MQLTSKVSTFTVETRKDKKAAPKLTQFTVDWTGCDEAIAINLAEQQLVVREQGKFRKLEAIPATHKVVMKDYATGARANVTPEMMEAAILEKAKSDPKERAALIAKLQALK